MFSRRTNIILLLILFGFILYYLLQNSPLTNYAVPTPDQRTNRAADSLI